MSSIVAVLQTGAVSATAPRPAHHLDDSKSRFTNPWPSYRAPPASSIASFLWQSLFNPAPIPPPEELSAVIPSQKPTWGADADKTDVKATWLGHACFLVELPTPIGAARGPRILFDPVLSHRCSPVPFMGPARYTPPPCKTEDIPAVDAIVLSHNHYDHTDTATLRTLTRLYAPHVFAPLGNAPYLASIGVPPSHIHVLDWWDARVVQLSLPSASASASVSSATVDPKSSKAGKEGEATPPTPASFKLTCTPSQHTANRSPFDRWQTLWASWALEDQPPSNTVTSGARPEGKKVFFAGDTAYRTVRADEHEDAVPVCPAFAEIGRRFGGFDLALIPIGAYGPRWLFSCVHAAPSDSVRIFRDVRARKALGMHWGTWVLTTEPVTEPPRLLREECDRAGVSADEFGVCALGETRTF